MLVAQPLPVGAAATAIVATASALPLLIGPLRIGCFIALPHYLPTPRTWWLSCADESCIIVDPNLAIEANRLKRSLTILMALAALSTTAIGDNDNNDQEPEAVCPNEIDPGSALPIFWNR